MEIQNRDYVIGKAYLIDDGATVVAEHAINVTGGVTDGFLEYQAKLWFDVLLDVASDTGNR